MLFGRVVSHRVKEFLLSTWPGKKHFVRADLVLAHRKSYPEILGACSPMLIYCLRREIHSVCTLSATMSALTVSVLKRMSFFNCVLFLFVILYSGMIGFPPWTTGMYHSERERVIMRVKIDLFSGIGSCSCGGWQIWNLYGRPATWNLRQDFHVTVFRQNSFNYEHFWG